jgi:SulP family sulfate permease
MRKFFSSSYLPLERGQIVADFTAGLTFAVVNVPQGMANAVLATVNPVFGLYALMLATPIGALFTGSVYMNVSTTGALSVAAGDALIHYPADQKTGALITLVLLIGLVQLLAGVLKLGTLVRFVAHSVMTGFITGIAVNIALGALPDLTGYVSPYNRALLRLADTLLGWDKLDPLTTILGLLTIGLILGFDRTPVKKFSMIAALAVITVLSVLLSFVSGPTSLELVGDIAEIPRSLPYPMLPDLTLIPALLTPAIAIAIIGLVQGAGVGQSYPNPDGKYPNVSQDFTGQGIANIAAGFFQGIPCGGSMSGTAVSINAGAQTRWANIFAGILVAVIVLLFVNIVKLVPMTALGGLLVVVGIQNIRPEQVTTVWQTGLVPRTAMVITFVATVAMPLQIAILLGVVISILLHVFQSSNRVEIVEIVPAEAGFPIEQPPPDNLPDNQVTILFVYGSLFFAAASTFEERLPEADEARGAVVILIVRGRVEVGSTFIGVLLRYNEALRANGGKLMLAGVSSTLKEQLDRTGSTAIIGEENLFMVQPQLGAPANEALSAARAWLADKGVD